MAGYRVAIPLQFIRKVYIGSVNMAADFEIDYIHISEILIHDKAVIFYPYILFVDVFDFRQGFFPCPIALLIYLVGILNGFLQGFLGGRNKFIEGNISAVLGRGIDVYNLALVFGIPQASANLCEQG